MAPVLMWVRIRAVIIEDEPLAAQYLASLLDETYQVELVGSATESEGGLQLCADLQPDAVFVDIRLPATDGLSLATRLAMLPRAPLLVIYNRRRKSGRRCISTRSRRLSVEAVGPGASIGNG